MFSNLKKTVMWIIAACCAVFIVTFSLANRTPIKIDIWPLPITQQVPLFALLLACIGIGILWGRSEYLNEMEPFLTGGSMIESVTMTEAKWAPSPKRFEAGVPNMAQAVGLGAACKYLSELGMDAVREHEIALTGYALEKMSSIDGIRIVGPLENVARGATVSFTLADIHPHDIGQYVDSQGVAVRTGHHCAWPLARAMNVPATTRASFYLYNDERDVDALVEALLGAQKYFGRF